MSNIKYHFVLVTLSDLFQLEDNAHLAAKVKINDYKICENATFIVAGLMQ
jgi:hypothetical protein